MNKDEILAAIRELESYVDAVDMGTTDWERVMAKIAILKLKISLL